MAARKMKLTVDWIVTTTGHGSEAGADPTGVHICWISQQCMCRKIFYMIKIHGQLININEVTDFHGGFLIFSALRSNTRWTILYGDHEYLYMRKKYLTIPLDF